MAFVAQKKGSPYWQAYYKAWNGQRWVKKSKTTKTTDREEAEEIAADFQRIANEAARANVKQANYRQFVEEMLREMGSVEMPTIEDYFSDWLESRRNLKPSSRKIYDYAIQSFFNWCGERRRDWINQLTLADCQQYYDDLIDNGLRPTTAANYLKVVSHCLNRAVAEGHRDHNPCAEVEKVRGAGQDKPRKPFTDEEVTRLIEACPEVFRKPAVARDWKTLILLGWCTGQRIGDCLRFRFEDVEEIEGIKILAFIPEKKERGGVIMRIPLIDPLKTHLERLPFDSGPMLPSLHHKATHGRGGASSQFSELVRRSGIDLDTKTGEGRGKSTQSKTFHSFRHTLKTRLMNAGVSREWCMAILGHDSETAHERYTHPQVEAMAREMAKLVSDENPLIPHLFPDLLTSHSPATNREIDNNR